MTLNNVGAIIEEAVLKSRKLKEGIIRGRWQEITGSLHQKSQPLWIKDKVLFVLVEDSIYLHHMSMNKNKYIQEVNRVLKNIYIDDIRFKVSKVKHEEYSEESKPHVFPKREFKSQLENLTLEEKIQVLKKQSKERERILEEMGYRRCKSCGTMFLGEGDRCMPCLLKEKKDSRYSIGG